MCVVLISDIFVLGLSDCIETLNTRSSNQGNAPGLTKHVFTLTKNEVIANIISYKKLPYDLVTIWLKIKYRYLFNLIHPLAVCSVDALDSLMGHLFWNWPLYYGE